MSEFSLANVKSGVAKTDITKSKLFQQDLKFIPSIKLMNSGSKEIKKPNENLPIKQGEFLWNRKILGKEFRNVPVAYRAKAISFEGGKVVDQCYDENDPLYEAIANSQSKDDNAGPEILFWLPDHNGFGMYHFTRTARIHAGAIVAMIMNPCIIFSDFVDGDAHSWYTLMGREGDFEITPDNSPTKEFFDDIMNMFNNPKVEKKNPEDKAPEKTGKSRKR